MMYWESKTRYLVFRMKYWEIEIRYWGFYFIVTTLEKIEIICSIIFISWVPMKWKLKFSILPIPDHILDGIP